MKQIEKLTKNQMEFLERKCGVKDVVTTRLIADDKDIIKVQLFNGIIKTFDKATGEEL